MGFLFLFFFIVACVFGLQRLLRPLVFMWGILDFAARICCPVLKLGRNSRVFPRLLLNSNDYTF